MLIWEIHLHIRIFLFRSDIAVCAAAAAKSLQSCLTLRPHRRQPTRLPRPWDSPGRNTGVGCHCLLRCMKVKSESEVAWWPHGLQPTRLLHPWDFPGKSPRVGCLCLLPQYVRLSYNVLSVSLSLSVSLTDSELLISLWQIQYYFTFFHWSHNQNLGQSFYLFWLKLSLRTQ